MAFKDPEPNQRLLCVQLESVLVSLLLVGQFLPSVSGCIVVAVHNSEVLGHVFVCASMNSNGLCCSQVEPGIIKEVTKRSIVPSVFWGQNTGPCVCLTHITQLHPKPTCVLYTQNQYIFLVYLTLDLKNMPSKQILCISVINPKANVWRF